jgi:allantoinase
VQSTLAVLLEQGHHRRGLPLERIASLLAAEPARRFRIPDKGAIEPGHDADLVLADLAQSPVLKPAALFQRHRISPYLGSTFQGKIVRTIRRGETIFENGRVAAPSPGKFVRPEPRH